LLPFPFLFFFFLNLFKRLLVVLLFLVILQKACKSIKNNLFESSLVSLVTFLLSFSSFFFLFLCPPLVCGFTISSRTNCLSSKFDSLCQTSSKFL